MSRIIREIIGHLKYCKLWLFASSEQRRWMNTFIKIHRALQPNIKGGNLEEDLHNSTKIHQKVLDRHYAGQLYAALCNNSFTCNKKKEPWDCTWRYAGGLVAELRGKDNEDYMTFYCNGNEGYIDDNVAEDLLELGWTPVDYEDER
jgi:hypothetical protein